MDKYSRYYGTFIFVIIVSVTLIIGYKVLQQSISDLSKTKIQLEQKEQEYNLKLEKKKIVERKLDQIRSASKDIQKKLYAPADSDLGNDTLFFTLYNDLIEMVHANSIKIKTMEYQYNPEDDTFVKFSRDMYFVSEVRMELISNYTNLGKFIQDLVQYPYFIKIMDVDIKPYAKDKKILVTDISLRMYARTAPEIKID